jgi:hypothetical protein
MVKNILLFPLLIQKNLPDWGRHLYFYVYHKLVHLPLRDVFLTLLCDEYYFHCIAKIGAMYNLPKIILGKRLRYAKT